MSERHRMRNQRYYQRHREVICEKVRAYRREHADVYREKQRIRMRAYRLRLLQNRPLESPSPTKEPKEPNAPKEPKEPKEPKAPKEPKELKKSPKATQPPLAPKEKPVYVSPYERGMFVLSFR